MGLFDKVFGGMAASKNLDKTEGFARILLATVAADGHVSDEEARGLFTILERMKLFESVTAEKFNAIMDRLLGILKREGPEALMNRAADALPPDLKDTAFANACDLVLADGSVEDEEKAFLDNLQKKLGISGDLALTIVEVMIVKNKG